MFCKEHKGIKNARNIAAGAANDALPHAAVSAELDLVAFKNQMELLGDRMFCESVGSISL